MTALAAGSLAPILSEARRLLRSGDYAAISCDVFDTVLLRRCTVPSGAFERAFHLLPEIRPAAAHAELFVQHRQIAEAAARMAARQKYGSPEVGIAEIYARFPHRLFGVDDAQTLIDAEFQAEAELCFANPGVAQLLAEAKDLGLRVGFLSDTYWSEDALAALLRAALPGLSWDFLYASSDRRNGKTQSLFSLCLRQRKLDPARVLHLGDNPEADVRIPARLGIRALHLPQCDEPLAALLPREDAVFHSACAATAPFFRLDGGARTLRRRIAAGLEISDAAFAYGAQVIGPVFDAFDAFAAHRVAEIAAVPDRRAAVAFVARDGFLPYRVWQTCGHGKAAYIEVNRRTALLAAADAPDSLAAFFRSIPRLDLASVTGFLKRETPRLRRYFSRAANGVVDGARFATDLPDLLGQDDLAALAQDGRQRLIAHLRREIADFDACTDLVLVDLGYAGTVQKALRAAFTRAGRKTNLHGVYLAMVDEDLCEVAPPDSAAGLISGAVLLPATRHALLSNVTPLEQICSAPGGSVDSYDEGGRVLREPNPRPPEQETLCARIRDGALAYAAAARAAAPSAPPDATGAAWAAAILARALLLPTDGELELLAPLRHDANLGRPGLAAMADAGTARRDLAALTLPAALEPRKPPMWMAGGLAHLSPAHGALFAVSAFGHLPDAALADAPVAEVTLVATERRQNRSFPIRVQAMRGAFGELRIRVPLTRRLNVAMVTFPAAVLPPRGRIEGVFLASGETAWQAAADTDPARLSAEAMIPAEIDLAPDGTYASAADGFLAVSLPPLAAEIGILTLTVTPGGGLRLLAAATAYPSNT